AVEWKAPLEQDHDREERGRGNDPGAFFQRATEQRAGDLTRQIIEIEIGKARDARRGEECRDDSQTKRRSPVEIGVDQRRSHAAGQYWPVAVAARNQTLHDRTKVQSSLLATAWYHASQSSGAVIIAEEVAS